MSFADVVEVAVAAVVLVWVVVRQVQARPLIARTMMIFPAVLAAAGVAELLRAPAHGGSLTQADITWIAIDLAAAVVTGGLRAPTVRLFERNGELWRQGSLLTVALWLVSIGAREAIGVIGGHDGAGPALDHGLLLSFGISLAAQYAVIALRGRRSAIPFATRPQEGT